jgi:ATP-dependent DNA helicase RecG
MPSDEKDAVMQAFSRGEIDVVVSTTVIEVGVDVPNASMMIIMDADRFGVSQLHQLRGRVGRGTTPGLCILVTNVTEDSLSMERLKAVAATTDGFELSRLDLEQRREGDVLGSAQSGVRSHLRLLRVIRDEEIIADAREVAERIVMSDPQLETMPHLKTEVDKLRQEERAAYLEKS